MKAILSLAFALTFLAAQAAPPAGQQSAPPRPIAIWPGGAPGGPHTTEPERDLTKPDDRNVADKPVLRLGNITKPTITVFRPEKARDNGTAVLVCPGGAYRIVAGDLEGTEVCEWLNSLGITGVLLKYRVPRAESGKPYAMAQQDAQRALSLVRSRAAEFGIRPDRIGTLGFSAGGHLAALLAYGPEERAYPPVDAADEVSFRPNFSLLIYPAYLTVKDQQDAIAPEFSLGPKSPPAFLLMAQDDPVRVETALYFSAALQKAKISFELHVFPKGGHGYGLRPTDEPITRWPRLASEWLKSSGFCRAKD